MANVKELEAQIRELRAVMEAHGIRATGETAVEEGPAPDYVAFGSPEHAALLGLVEVAAGEEDSELHATYTSPNSGKIYRLDDEYEPARTFPAMDPEKSARIILKQKVSSLESGRPTVPAHAPSMWKPRDMP